MLYALLIEDFTIDIRLKSDTAVIPFFGNRLWKLFKWRMFNWLLESLKKFWIDLDIPLTKWVQLKLQNNANVN